MSAPIYRDPLFDGATDPTIIRRHETGDWWMFYTQRRTTDPGPGVRWVHGTRIGIAVSRDDGSTWAYEGEARGLGHADDTLWAPEVIRVDDHYRMYLTVVPGVLSDWNGSRHIEEFRSRDLLEWEYIKQIDLPSDRVIDAAVARCADGFWRLWYKNERDESTTWAARSIDLEHWTDDGRVVGGPGHEGPNVFELGSWYWMVTDEWRGLGVHRSRDGIAWERQTVDAGLILAEPGQEPEDAGVAHHADIVVQPASSADREHAYIFYFTHAGAGGSRFAGIVPDDRPSPIHVARLTVVDDELVADRNVTLPLHLADEATPNRSE